MLDVVQLVVDVRLLLQGVTLADKGFHQHYQGVFHMHLDDAKLFITVIF